MKHRVDIPCAVTLVESRPDILVYEHRTIERERHSLKIRLPNGHTVEATVSHLEMQKIREILPAYAVDSPPPDESEETA